MRSQKVGGSKGRQWKDKKTWTNGGELFLAGCAFKNSETGSRKRLSRFVERREYESLKTNKIPDFIDDP
jgi:hypothetical protein